MIKFNWLILSIIFLPCLITFAALAEKTQAQARHDSSFDSNSDHNTINLEARRLELKRLEALNREEQEYKQQVARSWKILVLGLIAIVGGYHRENGTLLVAGCATVALSGARINYLHQINDYNAWERKEERDMIQKRLHAHSYSRKR